MDVERAEMGGTGMAEAELAMTTVVRSSNGSGREELLVLRVQIITCKWDAASSAGLNWHLRNWVDTVAKTLPAKDVHLNSIIAV